MSGDSTLAQSFAPLSGMTRLRFPPSVARLHAMVTSAGYELRTEPGYDWHGLQRGRAPYVLLQHTISGRGQLRVGRVRFVLDPGQTMLLRFPQDNRYWMERGDRWEFFWICLNGREVLRIWRDTLAVHGPVVRLGPAAIDRLAGFVKTVMRGETHSPARASTVAYSVAMTLADELLPWGEALSAGTRLDRIGRAVSLVHGRPSERLDVGRLADTAGYSRHHFSRLFQASEGLSPARYVARLRMEEAKEALRSSTLPVKTIARDCGFSDPSYFAKVFTRTFGVGPREFRRERE